MLTPEPRLFARPVLGDSLKALGLTLLGGAVLSFPFWLPTRWIVGVGITFGLVALWLVAFITLRTGRVTRPARRPPC